MDFLKYWDTRIDVYEHIFNSNPNLANFTFSECQNLYDHIEEENKALTAERDALRVELEALREACRPVVAWWKNEGPFLSWNTASKINRLSALVGEEGK